MSVAQLRHDQAWPWEHIPTQEDEWLFGGSDMEDYAWFDPFDGERIVSYDEESCPIIQIAGKEYDWEDGMWKCLNQKKRKYDALQDEHIDAAAEEVQVGQGDTVQQARPSNDAAELFSVEWRSALKADLKSKVRRELGDEARRLEEDMKRDIMKEVMEEMRSEMRSEMRLKIDRERAQEDSGQALATPSRTAAYETLIQRCLKFPDLATVSLT